MSISALHSQTTALRLKNGDRISGTILSETTNQVTLRTTWQKELVIPVIEISAREAIAPAAPIVTNAPVVAAVPTNAPVIAPVVTNAPVVAKTPPPVAKPVVVAPPVAPVKPKGQPSWHGDFQLGADVGLSEKNRQLYYGKAKIIYAPVGEAVPPGTYSFINRFRNTFDFNTSYGTTDGILSANRMDGSSKTDFDLGKSRSIFAYNLMGAGFDEIRKIDLRYEIGPGIGYHVLTRTNLILNVEFGMNYQVQNFQNNISTDKFYYRLAEDFTWKFSKKFTFDEKFEVFPQIDFAEYRFRLESNFRFWLLENLSFNLTLLDLYDTQPASNVSRNDLQIRSSIGVKF
ncbi:MAG: DUF481 domain-containing protein [Verrucomicrobiota bacterium]